MANERTFHVAASTGKREWSLRKQGNDMTNLNIEVSKLNDAELGAVAGGMDCKSAMFLATIHDLTATCLQAAGNYVGAAYFLGQAKGVMDGACPG
jgi:hypothetical protein